MDEDDRIVAQSPTLSLDVLESCPLFFMRILPYEADATTSANVLTDREAKLSFI
jgi:hypothetical protein